MARGKGTRSRGCMRVAAAAALALPLWLASCDGLPGPAASAPAGTAASPAAAPGAQVPAPRPQEPPPAGAVAAATPGAPIPVTPAAGPEAVAAGGGPVPSETAPGQPGGGATGSTAAGTGTVQAGPAGPSPAPSPEPAAGGGTAPPAQPTVTAYFVLLDDGGSNGVRFGCNDSLVGLQQAPLEGKDPLPSAMKALLAAGSGPGLQAPEPVTGRDVYNALAGSRLKFLSGSFDGTTVTVYLSGALSLGGVCDIPRLEAQLTQTALAAVGAVRAQIYLNGRPLAEVLRLGNSARQ